MAENDYLTLLNPLKKVDLNRLYVIFPITQKVVKHNTQKENIDYDYYFGEEIEQAGIEITVGFDKVVVALRHTIFNGDRDDPPIYSYLDVDSDKLLSVFEGINSSIDSVGRRVKQYDEDYGLPIRLTTYCRLNGIQLDSNKEKISVSDAVKLNRIIAKKNKGKKPVKLSYDKEVADRQIDEIFGINRFSHVSDEADAIIGQLRDLCNGYSIVFDKYVTNRINHYLALYKRGIKDEEPSYRKRKRTGEITLTLGGDPKTDLIINLSRMYNKLSGEIGLVSFLNDLYYSLELVKGEEVEEDNSKEDSRYIKNIKAIMENLYYLSNSKNDSITSELVQRIEQEINTVTKEIDKRVINHDKGKDTTISDLIYSSFNEGIEKIKDDTNKEADRFKKYVDFRNSLIENKSDEYKEDKNKDHIISDTIESVNFVLNTLEKNEQNMEIQEKWESLKQSFISRLGSLLEFPELLNYISSEELEREFRESLHPILLQLSFSVNQPKTNYLLTQLNHADELVKKYEETGKKVSDKEFEKYKREIVTSIVRDAIDGINPNDKQETYDVVSDLKKAIQKSRVELDGKKIKTLEQFNEEKNKLLFRFGAICYSTTGWDGEIKSPEKNNGGHSK